MDSGSEKVPMEVWTELTGMLDKPLCFRLAPKLGCDDKLVRAWGADGNTATKFAHEMFSDWTARDPPNQRSTLGQAFIAVGRRDLRNHLEEKCEELKKSPRPTASSSSATAAASGGSTGTGRGKKLKPGVLFKNISKWFNDINDVYDLADSLLEDIEPNGGTAWVKAKKDDGGVLDPKVKARELLDHWCKKSPDAYGGKLYKELYEILPNVADEFKDDLLSE